MSFNMDNSYFYDCLIIIRAFSYEIDVNTTLTNYHLEILATRKGMWDAVHSREHHIEKIFPFGPNATEFMLFGTVAYELKSGKRAEIPWGARATMVKESDVWKMGFYQVYLVRAVTFLALKIYYSVHASGEITNHATRILPQYRMRLRQQCRTRLYIY